MADKKDKKKKGADGPIVTISAHPRAKAGIRRARTRAAFGAFMLVLALNVVGNQDLFDAVWRALLAGIVVNVIVWRCAIVVWKHIIVSELKQEEERRIESVRARQEALKKLAEHAAEQSGNSPRTA
jgi:hypothetical protein